MPDISIRQVDAEMLSRYADIPITHDVESVFRVEQIGNGLGGVRLYEEQVPRYVKDVDAYEDGGPERWPQRFDIREWGLFLAMEQDRCIGGATVAVGAADLHILRGRNDVAALWDLRVRPEVRRQGIGTRLFEQAVSWARDKGHSRLMVETQNVNVPACRFYVAMGCELGGIDRYAYSGHPEVGHEVMLLWYLDLR
jgi:GNAT superfamily N-acetyltransferase